jgi:hypothetical protein
VINTYKKLFDIGQKEVIFLFTLVTNKGGHSIPRSLGKIEKMNGLLYPRGEKNTLF